MLRIYLLQCWFNLTDEGAEDATAANVHNVTATSKLPRQDDEVVYRGSAYLGLEKRDEIKNNPQLSRITRRPGRLPRVSDNDIDLGAVH